MLEQNTDRIYWTIGAVLVAGALILIAHLLFPQMFTNIIEFFQTKLTGAKGQKAEEFVKPAMISISNIMR